MADEVRAAVRWETSGKGQVIADAKEIGAAVETSQTKASVAGKKYMSDMAAAQREGMRQLKQHAAALELDAQMTEKAAAAARSMALTQIEAAAMNDKFSASTMTANRAVAASAQGMGTLKSGLASAVSVMSGLPPQLTMITSQLGVMTAGFLPVIAGLVAIGAGLAIWKLWNAEAIKAAEAQDKAVESLKQFNETARAGSGGQMAIDVELARQAVKRLNHEIETQTSPGGFSAMFDAFRVAFGGKSHAVAARDEAVTAAAEGQKNLDAKFGQTTGAMALQIQRQNELNASFGKGALALDLINNRFDYLDDRLKHSTGTTDGERAALDALSATLRAQKDEAARNATGWNETQRKARELTADLPALTAAFDALPPSLTRVNIGLVQTIGQYDAVMSVQTMLIQKHDEIKASLNALADKNKQTTDAQQAETAKSIAAQAKYAQDMKNISSSGFGKIITDGTKSFHDFFEDVLQMFSSMLSRMQQEGKGSTIGAKLLGIGSAAIGGGFAGYQIGQSTGSAASGLLGGAVSGAALGSAAGPWGAVVGGLAGAAGGMLGAAAAHREAAKQLKESADNFAKSVAAFAATNEVEKQLSSIRAQADALIKQAWDIAVGMVKQGGSAAGGADKYYSDSVDTVNKSAAAQAAKVADDFWRGINRDLMGLQGPAGAYANALDDIEHTYQTNMESARALHASQDDLNKIELLRIKQTQQLADAEDKRNADIQKSLGMRQLSAIFGSDSDQAFNAQQAQEIADAIAGNDSPQTIEMLKQTLKMEAANREQQKQTQILQDQLATANDQLNSLHSQEQDAKQTVATLQQTLATYQKGADALKLGPLTALSPAEQYAESLRELQDFVAKAQAGDANAASDVVSAANTFLQESKMMYATSEPYGKDFDYVQSLLSGLGLQTGEQLTTAEKMLQALQDQEKLLVAQIQIMNAQLQQSAYDAALARQTYVVGTANDPNYLAMNGVNPYVSNVPGASTLPGGSGYYPYAGTQGLPPWDPNSAAGQALAISMSQGTGGGPGKVFVPGQGWIDPHMAGNEWMLDPSNVSGPAYAAMKAAGYPGFARGGIFGGGMRGVGEHGFEMEITGPSHIVNTSDTQNMLARAMGASDDLLKMTTRLNDNVEKLLKQSIDDGRVGATAIVGEIRAVSKKIDAQVRIATFGDRNTGSG